MVPTWISQEHTLWFPLKKRLFEVFFHAKIAYDTPMQAYAIKAIFIFFLWALFVGLHLFFLQTFLYFELYWLDIVMHILGGGLVVATAFYINQSKIFPRYSALAISHPLTILVAFVIVWEIFRYAVATYIAPNYAFDTTLDIVLGLGGGLLVYWPLTSRTI